MEHLSGIAVGCCLAGNRLVKGIGDIVKHILAIGRQVNAGIGAEFGIDGTGCAITGGIEIRKIDALFPYVILKL